MDKCGYENCCWEQEAANTENGCCQEWENTNCCGDRWESEEETAEANENGQESETYKKGHVHELQGSVKIAGPNCELHNHRFAVTTGEAISTGPNRHIHKVTFKTDTYEGHEHEFCGVTSENTGVGDRHVHFIEGITEKAEGHRHEFRASTLINDPIGD